jgi:3-oxoadipate enol-lactonase
MSAVIRLHYIRRGTGAKLLLIQGASAGQQHWGDRFLTALSSRCEVVAYNPRGIGRSAPEYDNFTMGDFADDAARVLDQVGWERANVLGVSLGGVVAQELALRHPQRVERMILGGTNGGGSTGDVVHSVLDNSLLSAVVHGDRVATSLNLFRLGVKDPDTVAPEAWLEYQAAEMVLMDPRASVLQMAAYARHSTMGRLPQLRVPTLVLHGDSDRIIDLGDAIALTRAIPRAQLTVLSAGHFFWLEIPAQTAQLVADFCTADLREELTGR